MTLKDSILCKRILCSAALVLLTGGMILHSAVFSGANYIPVLDSSTSMSRTDPDGRISMIDEPADSRQVLTMGFVGNCIVGSMLGSGAYGTFNEQLEMEGPAYFLKGGVLCTGGRRLDGVRSGQCAQRRGLSPCRKE